MYHKYALLPNWSLNTVLAIMSMTSKQHDGSVRHLQAYIGQEYKSAAIVGH